LGGFVLVSVDAEQLRVDLHDINSAHAIAKINNDIAFFINF